jgi:hypothetical protein
MRKNSPAILSSIPPRPKSKQKEKTKTNGGLFPPHTPHYC